MERINSVLVAWRMRRVQFTFTRKGLLGHFLEYCLTIIAQFKAQLKQQLHQVSPMQRILIRGENIDEQVKFNDSSEGDRLFNLVLIIVACDKRHAKAGNGMLVR